MKLLILSRQDVVRALPMAEAISAMREAFSQLALGQAVLPQRTRLPLAEASDVLLVMPAYLKQSNAVAVKALSSVAANPPRGLPLLQAVLLAFDPEDGRPLALMEAEYLTALRTGAVSGAATDLLARYDASVAAVFGAGPQARTQLQAVCAVRDIESAWVYAPTRSKAEQLAAELHGQGRIPQDLRVAAIPTEAVREADVICTATSSAGPVFNSAALKPGVHVNAIGSHFPHMREVDTEMVRRARVVVDSRQACLTEAGDIVIPIEEGVITPDHIYAELGEITAGIKPGRCDAAEITLFKSVGLAIQDAAAAARVFSAARRLGLGTEVDL